MGKQQFDFDELSRDNDWGEYKKTSKKKRNQYRGETSSSRRNLKDYNLDDDYYEQEEREERGSRW